MVSEIDLQKLEASLRSKEDKLDDLITTTSFKLKQLEEKLLKVSQMKDEYKKRLEALVKKDLGIKQREMRLKEREQNLED